jgi:hypothetical protein
MDSRIPKRVQNSLRKMGHSIEVVYDIPWVPGGTVNFAVPVGILHDIENRMYHGGVDPFRPGTAVGY